MILSEKCSSEERERVEIGCTIYCLEICVEETGDLHRSFIKLEERIAVQKVFFGLRQGINPYSPASI